MSSDLVNPWVSCASSTVRSNPGRPFRSRCCSTITHSLLSTLSLILQEQCNHPAVHHRTTCDPEMLQCTHFDTCLHSIRLTH